MRFTDAENTLVRHDFEDGSSVVGPWPAVDGQWNRDCDELVAQHGQPEPFAPAVAVPSSISDRQFAQQLAILGTISQDEAIAWAARGDLPATLETAMAQLPAEQQFAARMLLSSATTYERTHPLTAMLGAILGYDAAELDDLWLSAAAL